MIVAVTGGTGFVGKLLIDRCLERGDQVRLFTRRSPASLPWKSQVEVFAGDLAEHTESLYEFAAGAEVLVHCAGEIRRPERMDAVHVEGTRRLIAAARGRIGRWVQLSSVGVYGPRTEGLIDENTLPEPEGAYETTKLQAEDQVQAAAAGGAFEAVILRPSIVFGPQMTNRSLFQWIDMIARRRFFYIGPPGASANYIPVESVVEALMRCASDTRAAGKAFNLSDWRSVEDFVTTIANALRVRPPRLRVPAGPLKQLARASAWIPGMPLTEARVRALCSRAKYSSERIERELEFAHPLSMEDALREMVARRPVPTSRSHPS